jgi:hypothetical protein
MEAWAASAGGIGSRAKSRDCGRKHRCCKKIFHAFSLKFGLHRADRQNPSRVIRQVEYLEKLKHLWPSLVTETERGMNAG